MRTAGFLFVPLLCLTSTARAQVSVDMRALDSLGPAPPAARAAPVRPVVKPAPPPVPAAASVTPQAPAPVAPAPVASIPVPALPTEQPATPAASAMIPVPVASPEPLPPPVRLVFEAGKTELTAGDEAAIQGLARSIPTPATSSVNVVAYAAGKADDASTARRLSLSRGMAVRSVLLASGVPSAQIYVRALGATATDGPADRVELVVTRIGTVTR